MTISENLLEAMLKLVQQRHPEAEIVTDYDENLYQDGGCESCAYSTWEVDIFYRRVDGTSGIFTYDGRFSRLIKTLDALS